MEPPKVKLIETRIDALRAIFVARRNILRLIPKSATRRDLVSGRWRGGRWHMVMAPDLLEQVLRRNVEIYPKSDMTRAIMGPAVGQSIFVAHGADWRWQRRAAAPSFAPATLDTYLPVIEAAGQRCLTRLADHKGPVDLFQQMVETTFEIIATVCFSTSNNLDSDEINQAMDRYLDEISRGSLLRRGVIFRLTKGMGQRQTDALNAPIALADKILQERLASPHKTPQDLLDHLILAQDPKSGRMMDARALRENLLTFIVAGHKTTAIALSWALYCLAHMPELQERLCAGLRGGQHPALLDNVLKEAMRLYPSSAVVSRQALAPDQLREETVDAGDLVVLPIYAIHRHEKHWDHPNQFDPDRFLVAPQRYAYLPFGDGPRACIGAGFAMQEMRVLLSAIVKNFEIRPVGPAPRPEMILTLQPVGGVNLILNPR